MTVINDDDDNDDVESQNLIKKSNNKNNIVDRNNGKFNVIILGLSFCILFSAFSPTQNLQTTINQKLGSYSLALIYSILSISNFISPFIVLKFGERLSLIIATLSYVAYISSNIYVTEASIYISSVLVGFGGAILWTSQGSLVLNFSTESTIGEYTGLFFALFQTDQIIGNLGAATLINKAGLGDELLFIIFSIVAFIPIIGFLIMGKPSIKRDLNSIDSEDLIENNETVSVKEHLLSTILLVIKNKPIQLLIPAFLYSGISQSFFFGNFSLLIGKNWIGYVMSIFGLCDALGSYFIGKLSDKIGRKVLVFLGTLFCIVGTVLVYLSNYNYQINENQTFKILFYFISAALFGFSDAVYNTQLYSLIGTLYPTKGEASTSVFKFFQSIATAIAFIYGSYISLFFIITIMNFFIILSFILFIFADNFIK